MNALTADREEVPTRQPIDGVLLLDKPLGWSSNQALQRAKRLIGAKKAGHTGTLDPAATGLLVVCFGEATKLAGIGLTEDKTYEAYVSLGVSTDTGDAEGRITARQPFTGTVSDIKAALDRLCGAITQIPPLYSALKHQGKPLYDYARAGQWVERETRTAHIHELVLIRPEGERLWLRVTCSKGTYIRTLAEQIGAELGCPAHLAGLRRTRIGLLSVDEAQTLATLEAQPIEIRRSHIQPPQILLQSVPSLILDEPAVRAVRQGQLLRRAVERSGLVQLQGPGGELVGLAQAGADGTIAPKRILLPTAAASDTA